MNGIGRTSSGVASDAPGTNRPRYDAKTTAPAAIAPEKPATNDVQPVRNAASRPNAASRYTYSPPALGRTVASSAYAIAPANASAPPTAHVARNPVGLGTLSATCGGVKRMPPPITLDTMIAAASNGPNRRVRTAGPEAGMKRGV